MSDKERERDWVVEAIEKVTPTPADRPALCSPHISTTTKEPCVNSTAVTLSQASEEIAAIASKDIMIGRDFESGVPVRITDKEREGGFYVLGQPRMGKSELLISMALQDIDNGHGVLFIDPHYDAINKLLARIAKARLQNVILLDPSDNTRSFGVNLLHCPDPENEIELDKAAGRVRDIFTKLWADERGELGIWLNKIMTNAVQILLANPGKGYTLADIPLILKDDRTFRNSLLKNVQKTTVKDFWYDEFDTLSRRDQTDQVGPAKSRLDLLLADSRVRDIVGQSESSIDFADILRSGKIVLLSRASNIDPSIKNLIGTIVLSEFLYAVYERAKLPEEERTYFGIYCDEFQEFATPDFAKLFTQTGKLGAMPVVTHQTREQFKSRDDPNRGATAASPNKVFFTLSPYDGNEMPLVFAKAPPTETRREQELVICEDPVSDLLRRPHRNPDIRRFVNECLRPIQDRLVDTREDMEGERLLRLNDLDEASVHGFEERMAAISLPFFSEQMQALERRGAALTRVQEGTRRLQSLYGTSKRLRLTIRGLNRVLTEVMEGTCRPGQKAFSDFLISVIGSYSRVPENYTKLLEAYISVMYGDANEPYVLPVAFVRKYALWTDREIDRRLEDTYRSQVLLRFEESEAKKRLGEDAAENKSLEDIYRQLSGFRTWNGGYGGEKAVSEDALRTYILLHNYPGLADLLTPYLTARFRQPWKGVFEREIAGFFMDEMTEKSYQFERVKEPVLKEVASFLRCHGEGAMVVTALLDTGLGLWADNLGNTKYNPLPAESRAYRSMHMLEFPAIAGKEPLEILLFISKLNDVLGTIIPGAGSHFAPVYEYNPNTYGEEHIRQAIANNFLLRCVKITPRDLFKAHDCPPSKLAQQKEEVAGWLLGQVNRAPEGCFDPDTARLWTSLDEFTRGYLIARSCDIVWFGERVAKYTYPEPAIQGVRNEQVERMVSVLNGMAEQDRKGRRRKEEERKKAGFLSYVQKVVAETDPDHLEEEVKELRPQVLKGKELERLKEACRSEIESAPQAAKMMQVVNSFVEFCSLLATPENHIMVPSGQYVEREVRERTEIDMVNEAARLLSSVERYTAYVRLEKKESGLGAWIGKVRMEALAGVADDALANAKRAIEDNINHYTRTRGEIREEIRKRQEPWRRRMLTQAPEAAEEGKEAMTTKRGESAPEEPMPPTSITQDLKEGEADRQEKEEKAEGAARGIEGVAPPQATEILVERAEAPEWALRLEERLVGQPGEAAQIPASLKAALPIIPKGSVAGSGYGYRGEVVALTESELVRIYSDQYMRLNASGKSQREIIRGLIEIITADMYLSEDGSALGVTYEDEPEREAAVLTTRFYPRGESEEIRQ